MKIYSFLPSATEIVYSLGLGDQLCGVTNECDYPVDAKTKPVVVQSLIDPSAMEQGEIDWRVVNDMSHGHGLYRINRDLLLKEKPDLVITQELCDVCSVSLKEVLKTISDLSAECTVISLRPHGLEGVLDDIVTVGNATGTEVRARAVVDSLRARIESVRIRARGLKRKRTFCAEWYDPVFAPGHWVPEMVEIAGGREVVGVAGEESKKVPWEQVASQDPEVVVLIPCGFGVDRAVSDSDLMTRLPGWRELLRREERGGLRCRRLVVLLKAGSAVLVDGLELLSKLIHPEVFGRDIPAIMAVPLSSRIQNLS